MPRPSRSRTGSRVLVLAFWLAATACRKEAPPAPPARARPAAPTPSAAPSPAFPPGIVHGKLPAAAEPLPAVLARVLDLAKAGQMARLEPELSAASLRRLGQVRSPGGPLPLTPPTLLQRFEGRVTRVDAQGGRAIVEVQTAKGPVTSAFFLEGGRWKLDLTQSRAAEATPGPPDPLNHPVSLQDATAGIAGAGPLVAVLETTAGAITCTLEEQRAPRTVANFVGLARGLRASLRRELASEPPAWKMRPFYDGLAFYRALPDVAIEGGCPLDRGMGQAGYQIADELDLSLRHDRPGVLSMATMGPNTGSSRFSLTARAMPAFDDRQSVFGYCRDTETIARISRMPAGSVRIQKVTFRRGP